MLLHDGADALIQFPPLALFGLLALARAVGLALFLALPQGIGFLQGQVIGIRFGNAGRFAALRFPTRFALRFVLRQAQGPQLVLQ